jgi:DMSO/TMAO reductase YedYZ molybdopterin-dependent catalytic subunit
MSADEPNRTVLAVDGAVENRLGLSFDDLAALPAEDQIPDVAPYHPGRSGHGVDLRALLRLAVPRPEARFLTLHADRDDFHVSIPLEAIRDRGMVVYRRGDGPLDPTAGGPIRFLVRDPATCHSAELDDCANVKYLSRIELTTGRGRDTRPEDDASHAALHERQAGG